MGGVTYDTGALIAADHNDRRMWALHDGFLALVVSPTVSSITQGRVAMVMVTERQVNTPAVVRRKQQLCD